jgi:putative addiction module component (TIGR02574 family)
MYRATLETMATISRSDFLQLPLDERLQLLEELWESIAGNPEAVPLTEAQKRELDRRWALYEQDPERGISWDQAKAEILGDL